MYYIGSKPVEEPPQSQCRDGIRIRRLIALATIADKQGKRSSHLADPMNPNTVLQLLIGKTAMPDSGYGDFISTLAKFLRKELGLTMCSTDEGRIMVTDQQDLQTHNYRIPSRDKVTVRAGRSGRSSR